MLKCKFKVVIVVFSHFCPKMNYLFQNQILNIWPISAYNSCQCRIQQLFGGANFSTSVARRKTAVLLGSPGQHCKLSPVKSRGETLEMFDYFVFWIAQNIALLALQQGTLTKVYTRNQHFWVFESLSLGSQTGMPASK